jgi:Tol biopolymer transport system component
MTTGRITALCTATLLSTSLILAGTGPALAASGPLVLVSVSSSGLIGSGGATSISADGRYVVFGSNQDYLIPGDTNNSSDVLVRDRWTATTSRVSLSDTDQQTPPPGDENTGHSGAGTISADGRYVAFSSTARNLTATNPFGASEIYVRDRRAGTTRMVSVSDDGMAMGLDSYEPKISGNGRYVVFSHLYGGVGEVGGVADVYRHDLRTATTRLVPAAATWSMIDANGPRPSISHDGRYVAFTSEAALTPGDTNTVEDVFVHDFARGTTRLVSRPVTGGQTTADSYTGEFSADGRYVVFCSDDTGLVRGDVNGQTDVFVHDVRTGVTSLISKSSAGVQGNGRSYAWMTISGDGRHVGFGSTADNLVAGDTNGYLDVFVHDRRTATTTRVSQPNGGDEADGESIGPVISADGRHIAFTSMADLIADGASTAFNARVYVRRMPVHATK